MFDRRSALTMLVGAATGVVLDGEPAQALTPARTSSILLFNRTSGAWLVQVPGGLEVAGARYSGISKLRFAGRTAAAGVVRRFGTGPVQSGVLTLRGSSSVTPSWEVIGFNRSGWSRRAGGDLAFNGVRWAPAGQLLDDDTHLTMIGAQQSAYMRLELTASSATAWSLRTRAVQRLFQPVDTAYAMAAQGPSISFGMAPGGTLAEFQNVNALTDRAPSLRVTATLPTLRGHVYGPVTGLLGSVLLIYDRATGIGQFVQLTANRRLGGARVIFTARLGSGWSHIVPFRYGWFFYHRARRCAQMMTIDPYFLAGSNYRLRYGIVWPDGSLPDFSDALGFA